MGVISKKIISEFQKNKKNNVFNLQQIQNSKEKFAEIDKELNAKINQKFSDQSNKAYIITQNLLSYFAEDFSVEEDFTEYYDKVEELEDEYMPAYPPLSPVTGTYFTYACFCDLQFGKDKETIGTIFYDVCVEFDLEETLLSAVKNLNKSYAGFYKHMGFKENLIMLMEISSGKIFYCICPAGYKGRKNEIWYVRIVPNLDDVYDYHITITTPYIILNSRDTDWIDFYERQGLRKGEKDFNNKEQDLLKYHPEIKYWYNYLTDGYVNFTSNCIYLTGMPDIKGSKPHELDDEF